MPILVSIARAKESEEPRCADQVTLVQVSKSSEQPLTAWGEVNVDKPRKARATPMAAMASGSSGTLGSMDTIKKARA